MGNLVFLVENSVLCCFRARGERSIITLGDILVGLLRSLGAGPLDGLGKVLSSVLGPRLVRRSDMHMIGTNLDSLHCEIDVWLT